MASGGQNILVRIGANISALEHSLQQASSKVSRFGKSLSSIGDSMTKSVSAPLAGVGAIAVSSFASAEQATGKLQAQLGITSGEADKLTEMAKGIYEKGFGTSLQETTTALANVKRNMEGLPEDKLQAVAQGAMTIGETFDQDVNEVTRSAGMLMQQFGVSGEDALDMITVGYQKGLDKNGDFLDSLNEYAPQFKAMGMDSTDMFNTFVKGAESGAFNIDKVGDAVKEFNIRVKDGSKTTADGMAGLSKSTQGVWKEMQNGKATGEEVFNAVVGDLAKMDDKVKANQIGVSLFGSQWEDLESDVVTAMATGGNALGEFKGATDTAGESLKANFSDRMAGVWRTFKDDLEPLGAVIADLAERLLPALGSAISGVSKWFSELSPTMQNVVLGVGGFVLALGPLLMLFGSVVGAIAPLIPLFAKLGTAFTFLGTKVLPIFKTAIMGIGTALRFLALNPIGIAITAIAGLIAIAVAVYKNWDSIKPVLVAVWDYVANAVSAVWNWIVDLAKTVWSGFASFFTGLWNGIKNFAVSIWNGISSFLSGLWSGIVAIGKAVWNGLKTYFTTVFNAYKTIITTVWNGIKSFVTKLWNGIVTTATAIFNRLRSGITNIFNGIKSVATTVWNAVKNFVVNAITNLKNRAVAIFNTLKSSIQNIWNTVKSTVTNVVSGMKNSVVNTFNNIKSTATRVFNGVKTAITKPIESAKKTVSGIVNDIKGFFSGLKLKLPKISMPKLPKFSLKGKFSLNPPSVPKLGVNWYKTGGVFDGASVIGVGEAGAEAVVPLSGSRMKPFAKEIANQMPDNGTYVGGGNGFGGDVVINLDGREIARASAQHMDSQLRNRRDSKSRARGGN